MSVAQAVGSLPLVSLSPANLGCRWSGQSKQIEHGTARSLSHHQLMVSSTVRLPTQLANPMKSHSAALNVRCSASGQTQTVLKQTPTITKAPVKEPTKTPEIDDGGTGLPPGDDGGGGGGGGGGGNWSGGFFLFGFLAFLGLLKDSESDNEDRR
ncbi:Protein YELLOW LEAF 1, choloroplastic [Linum perenne]